MKECPILFTSPDTCCGCSACEAICPTGAIGMVRDEQGFLYPAIDAERCCRCYRCTAVCDFKKRD